MKPAPWMGKCILAAAVVTGMVPFAGGALPAAQAEVASTDIVHAFAGMPNQSGDSGNGSPATAARLQQPFGLAVDGHGNVYIADSGNNRIKKVDTNGILTYIAGTGVFGYNPEETSALRAQFRSPSDVDVDASGNLYVADAFNCVSRKITPDGKISTFAGTGNARADAYTQAAPGDNGPVPATSSNLGNIRGVAVDQKGNVYFGDGRNHRIMKVTPDGMMTTVAGAGPSYASGIPARTAYLVGSFAGLDVDDAGNLYVADDLNFRIVKITPDGILTTIAGNFNRAYSGENVPAAGSSIGVVNGLAVADDGIVYFADTDWNRIRKIDSNGILSTVAGDGVRQSTGDGGPAYTAQVDYPYGVAVSDDDRLYFSEFNHYHVRVVIPD